VPPFTAPEVVIEIDPDPVFSAKIAVLPPLTAAAVMVRSVPEFRAFIPSCEVPETVPVDVIDKAPVPVLRPLIPVTPPFTSTVDIVRSVEVAPFSE
jgi:hypothetical protein